MAKIVPFISSKGSVGKISLKPLHERLHSLISALRGAQNAHLLRVNSAFSAPCALKSARSAVRAKVSHYRLS